MMGMHAWQLLRACGCGIGIGIATAATEVKRSAKVARRLMVWKPIVSELDECCSIFLSRLDGMERAAGGE
jgi:hypothetical protein